MHTLLGGNLQELHNKAFFHQNTLTYCPRGPSRLCFFMSRTRLDWDEAKDVRIYLYKNQHNNESINQFCENNNGHLAGLGQKKKDRNVNKYLDRNTYYWIGLNAQDEPGIHICLRSKADL